MISYYSKWFFCFLLLEIWVGVLLLMIGCWLIGMWIVVVVFMVIIDVMNDFILLLGYNIMYEIFDSLCEFENGFWGMVVFKNVDLFIGFVCFVVIELVVLFVKIWNKFIIIYVVFLSKFINKGVYSMFGIIIVYVRCNECYILKFVF